MPKEHLLFVERHGGERGREPHKFRYVGMLGDGDTKTHAAVRRLDPYNGIPIEKIECLNHITKRMGTALHNLVQQKKAQKKPIGGRGCLTADRIDKLTEYYGKAIRDNKGDLQNMQNAVWASLFHTMSSDEDPHHSHCPQGPQSWCSYNRARTNNRQPPPAMKPLPAMSGRPSSPSTVAWVLRAHSQSHPMAGCRMLLRRCLSGKTQNSVLWHIDHCADCRRYRCATIQQGLHSPSGCDGGAGTHCLQDG